MTPWVDIHLGNYLLPDGTKLLPEPMLTYGIHPRAVSLDRLKISITKITRMKLQPHFPGVNEDGFILLGCVKSRLESSDWPVMKRIAVMFCRLQIFEFLDESFETYIVSPDLHTLLNISKFIYIYLFYYFLWYTCIPCLNTDWWMCVLLFH